MAILMKIECETPEQEVQEFNAMFTPKTIYDDVAALIEEVASLTNLVDSLSGEVEAIDRDTLRKYSRDITDQNLDDLIEND